MKRVSVIIPTHNRAAWITDAVKQLHRQDYSGAIEIIVVTDRCTDGTPAALRAQFDDSIAIIESPAPGQPAALNAGIAAATGDLAIFLDDEMRPRPGFVAAHVAAHAVEPTASIVVTGYSPVHLDGASLPVHAYMAERYALYHGTLARGELARSPSGLNGANASIPLDALRAAGGFNASYFFQRNDFELAARLIERGFSIRYAPEARADQHLAITADAMVNRAEPRGENDARLAREFPWCAASLPFGPQLSRPIAASKWRALWIGRSFLPGVLGRLRRARPHSLTFLRLEYAARYSVAVIRSTGGWSGFRALARSTAR